MYPRVVVGTEGSETAAIAVRRAIELAAAMKAELHVVHAHQLLNLSVASVDAKAGARSSEISKVDSGLRHESDDICESSVREDRRATIRPGQCAQQGVAPFSVRRAHRQQRSQLRPTGRRIEPYSCSSPLRRWRTRSM